MRLRQQQRGMLVAARQQLLASLDAIMQRRAEILDALRPTSQSDSDCFNVDKITAVSAVFVPVSKHRSPSDAFSTDDLFLCCIWNPCSAHEPDCCGAGSSLSRRPTKQCHGGA